MGGKGGILPGAVPPPPVGAGSSNLSASPDQAAPFLLVQLFSAVSWAPRGREPGSGGRSESRAAGVPGWRRDAQTRFLLVGPVGSHGLGGIRCHPWESGC